MAVERGPKIVFKRPTFRAGDEDVEASAASSSAKPGKQKQPFQQSSHLRQRPNKHLCVEEPVFQRPAARHDIYLGSYARSSPRNSVDGRAPGTSRGPSPRASTSHLQLEHLLQAVDADLETYGVEELRDGFFDASFYRPLQRHHDELMHKASLTLPESFKQKNHPLSLRRFLPQQFHEVESFFCQISTSMAGIQLLKSFLGFFITYIICLIPASRDWLGRYNYIMVISAIINHPGRAIGSQLDGAVLTTIGTIAGLGWGSFALYVSTSTPTAQSGYGGVLATFLVIFAALIGWLRCVLIRFHQAVLSAGIAICYICLANTSQRVSWIKVFHYGIPWVLGQVVCLVVSVLVFPDAGSRSLAIAFHDSLQTVRDGLTLPHENSLVLKQKLASQFVNLSQAVRDFTIEFTVSRLLPDDVRSVRNLLQAVQRSILSIRPDTTLFNDLDDATNGVTQYINATTERLPQPPILVNKRTIHLISSCLREPTRGLIDAMIESIECADAAILTISGQSSSKTPVLTPVLVAKSLERLRSAREAFDLADALLVGHPDLPSLYHKSGDVVGLFLFVHPVRQTADKVEMFVAKVVEIQTTNRHWGIRLPSYPFYKAIMRTNAQVRHDRGGLTAGFYFRSQRQLDRTMSDLQSTAYVPAIRHQVADEDSNEESAMGEYRLEQEMASGKHPEVSRKARFRYQLWEVLHRLQGFESRFAFKVTLVTTLLSIPAWLVQSRGWWNEHESWWAVVAVWTMMHPRVGGTFQDLGVRSFYAAIGAIWGGLAYAADRGNPYVMAVFAAVFMIPMLHRFTQSSHPRSGIIGCLSFTVVSLGAYTAHGEPSIVKFAWTRGLAFILGVVAALAVNLMLWPFIARHELRMSLSAMMLHSAILYRGVISKYIYYAKGEEPGPEDIARSEMLEGRLREGFVRMRQLMELTRHEMRLRAPFNPLPYSALIASCESFFEHLVQVRQSSLYFQPSMVASDPTTVSSLTGPRRDAVAVILMNLYILASALRLGQPVPRYLPSAAAARRKLLDRMEMIEAEQARKAEADGSGKAHEYGGGRRWADVYQYAYSGALTDIVEQLQELQRFTKEVCGEVGWESDEAVGE